jgi:hypothetical protein
MMLAMVKRVGVIVVTCVVVASTLAACASNDAARTVSVAPAISVGVPAGSSSFTPTATPDPHADASLLAAISLSKGPKLPSPLLALASPVHLSANGPFPPAGVELSFHVTPESVAKGVTPFIATYQPGARSWLPVASTYSAKRGVVQAHITHFSLWGVFSFSVLALTAIIKGAFDSLFGAIKVTDAAPTCGGSAGLASTIAPNDGIYQFCPQNASGDSATVKVNTQLAFPADVTAPANAQISVTPSSDLFTQIGGYITQADHTKIGSAPPNQSVIAAGSEADVTVPVAAGSSVNVETGIDGIAYLTGIIASGIDVLNAMEDELGGNAKQTLEAIDTGRCAAEIGQLGDVTSSFTTAELTGLTKVAIDCAGSVVDLGNLGPVQALIVAASSLVEDVIQTAFLGAIDVIGGASGGLATITTSRQATPASLSPATPTAPPPTAALPVLVAPGGDGEPFNGIEPVVMYFSNDDGNVVLGITWSSWTSGQATGSGTWDYEDCLPDCADGSQTPYPATIQLSQPINGVFTSMTETTSGPDGSIDSYTYPSNWVIGASS